MLKLKDSVLFHFSTSNQPRILDYHSLPNHHLMGLRWLQLHVTSDSPMLHMDILVIFAGEAPC